MITENLTPELAYLAMYEFLVDIYQRTKSDECKRPAAPPLLRLRREG